MLAMLARTDTPCLSLIATAVRTSLDGHRDLSQCVRRDGAGVGLEQVELRRAQSFNHNPLDVAKPIISGDVT